MAIPGILIQLVKNNPMIGQARQMMETLKTAQNPQAMLNQMMMNNPKLKQVMELVNQYGGDPNKALEEVSKQYGVTAQDIYDLLK